VLPLVTSPSVKLKEGAFCPEVSGVGRGTRIRESI
jgi:hypothetical protein